MVLPPRTFDAINAINGIRRFYEGGRGFGGGDYFRGVSNFPGRAVVFCFVGRVGAFFRCCVLLAEKIFFFERNFKCIEILLREIRFLLLIFGGEFPPRFARVSITIGHDRVHSSSSQYLFSELLPTLSIVSIVSVALDALGEKNIESYLRWWYGESCDDSYRCRRCFRCYHQEHR